MYILITNFMAPLSSFDELRIALVGFRRSALWLRKCCPEAQQCLDKHHGTSFGALLVRVSVVGTYQR